MIPGNEVRYSVNTKQLIKMTDRSQVLPSVGLLADRSVHYSDLNSQFQGLLGMISGFTAFLSALDSAGEKSPMSLTPEARDLITGVLMLDQMQFGTTESPETRTTTTIPVSQTGVSA